MKPGNRRGIYVFKDAAIVDYAARHGVISVARVVEYQAASDLYAADLAVVATAR